MFETLKSVFKVKEMRRKLLYLIWRMVYFYMIILTYTPNERDIIQNAPNPLF